MGLINPAPSELDDWSQIDEDNADFYKNAEFIAVSIVSLVRNFTGSSATLTNWASDFFGCRNNGRFCCYRMWKKKK